MEIKNSNDVIKNIKEIILSKIKCNYLYKYSSLNDESNQLFHPLITCNLDTEKADIYMDIKCYNDRLKREKSPIVLNLDYFDKVGSEFHLEAYNIYFISINYSAYMKIVFDEEGRLLETLSEIIGNTKTKRIESFNNYCIEQHWNLLL